MSKGIMQTGGGENTIVLVSTRPWILQNFPAWQIEHQRCDGSEYNNYLLIA